MLGNSVASGHAGLLDFIDGLVSHKHFFSGCYSGNEGTSNIGMFGLLLGGLFLGSGGGVVSLVDHAGGAGLLLREQVGEALIDILVGVSVHHVIVGLIV